MKLVEKVIAGFPSTLSDKFPLGNPSAATFLTCHTPSNAGRSTRVKAVTIQEEPDDSQDYNRSAATQQHKREQPVAHVAPPVRGRGSLPCAQGLNFLQFRGSGDGLDSIGESSACAPFSCTGKDNIPYGNLRFYHSNATNAYFLAGSPLAFKRPSPALDAETQ